MSDQPTRTLPPDGELTADPPASADATRDGHPPTVDLVVAVTETASALPVAPGYELLEEVGAGGMGSVYRAREIAFDRDVAVKLLQERYPSNSLAARRFLDEARITGQLQHPAIPPVHHIGTLPDGRPFLAMKLIKGDTLADLLATQPSSLGRFVAVFAQVCHAVAYAHSRKVIHRDMKPANIMVGSFGEVQLMDWGLAKVLTRPENDRPEATEAEDNETEIRTQRDGEMMTQAGSVMGTPSFMAPEQAAGEVEKIDERSDVFGLGAVLCAILTGKPPYLGLKTDSVRLLAIRCETADAFARLDASGADPELVALCKRCLAREREDRPCDAGEVAKAVASHLAAVEDRARQAELDHVRAEERRKRRRVQFVLAGSVLLVLALVGFGAGLASLWREAKSARDDALKLSGIAEAGRIEESHLRGIADNARDQAFSLKGIAEKAQANEAVARKAVEREREKLAVVEYGRTMEVAHQEWRENNFVSALALLDSTRPDLRGWEWHYVHRLCHSELLTLKGKPSVMFFASFSSDGSRIVTCGGNDNQTKVWDAGTGKELLTLKGHAEPNFPASFSPDGSQILTGGHGPYVKVWDAETGDVKHFSQGSHAGTINSASFSADRSRVVTGSDDKTAKVWDAKTGAELFTLKGHTNRVWSASFSADGSWVVTGSEDKTAKVWNLLTGKECFILKGHTSAVLSASFSTDELKIVTGSGDGTAKVWDAKTGTELLTLKGHSDCVWSAAFTADGSRIVTGSFDKTAKIWDAKTGAELFTLKGHTNRVWSASFTADGSRVVTGSSDATAKVWDAKIGPELVAFEGDKGSFSADGLSIVTTVNDWTGKVYTAKRWDAWTGTTYLLTLKGHTDYVSSASFSADGSRIVTSSADNTAKVWDAKTGAKLLTLKGHTKGVNSASFSADGSRIVTTSQDFKVKVWDANTGADLLTLQDFFKGSVNSASFNSDGSQIVTSHVDNTAKVWDAKTGAKLLTLKGHTLKWDSRGVNCASFSTDGSRIVTGSGDATAKVWDAKTGAELLTLNGHSEFVGSASFSPDGTRIVTSGNTVKVWDAKTGAELLTLKGKMSYMHSASFSGDGSRIIAASDDKTVKVWDSRPFRDTQLPPPEPACGLGK